MPRVWQPARAGCDHLRQVFRHPACSKRRGLRGGQGSRAEGGGEELPAVRRQAEQVEALDHGYPAITSPTSPPRPSPLLPQVPDPVMSLALTPSSSDSFPSFTKALQRFQKEDPTFRVGGQGVRPHSVSPSPRSSCLSLHVLRRTPSDQGRRARHVKPIPLHSPPPHHRSAHPRMAAYRTAPFR